MLTHQRGGLDRVVVDEDRAPQLVLAQELPDLLDELAVAPAAVLRNLQADDLRERLELLDGGVDGDLRLIRELLGQRLIQGRVDLDDRPLAAEVVLGAVVHGQLGGAEDLLGDLLDDLAGHRRSGVVVPVRLVGLQHRKLRAVGAVDALIAEVAVDFEDAVQTTDDGALEVQLRRDAQVEVDIQRIGVGHERASRGTTVQSLQHRGLELIEPAALQGVAQGAHHLDAGHGVLAGFLAHDQVGVTVTHAGVLAHLLVRDRQRTQRLGGHGPLLGHDRKLAAAGGDHAPLGEDDVAQVDLRLPAVQRFRADLCLGEHDLQLGAVAVLEGGEGQLAGIADEHHAASHADDAVRFLTDVEEGCPLRKSGELFRSLRIVLLGLHCPLLTNLRQRVSPGNFYWISLTALVKDALALLAANAHLLGNFIIAGGWILCSHPTRLLHRRYTPVSGSPTQINPSMARQTGPGPPLAEPRYAPAG